MEKGEREQETDVDTVQVKPRETLDWKLLQGAIQAYQLNGEYGWQITARDMGTGAESSDTGGEDVFVGKHEDGAKTTWLAARGTDNRLAGDLQWLGGNVKMPLEKLTHDGV